MTTKIIANLCLILAAVFAGGARADAAFITPYGPGNFTLVNSNADGVATLQQNGSLLIIGGNNGSDSEGTTDFLVAAVEVGIVSFNFFYSTQDDPFFDYAGYILGNSFIQFADIIGTSGSVSFSVAAGQIFGFRVGTTDNTGEPGELTISDFSAPGSTGVATPEPSTWLTMTAGFAALAAWRRRTGRDSNLMAR